MSNIELLAKIEVEWHTFFDTINKSEEKLIKNEKICNFVENFKKRHGENLYMLYKDDNILTETYDRFVTNMNFRLVENGLCSLVDSICVSVGRTKIDKDYDNWLQIWKELSKSKNKN